MLPIPVVPSAAGMMSEPVDIGPYEGLVYTTAARYVDYLEDDLDDIRQDLRVKVWQALRSYNPARATQPVQGYVYSCVANRVKDMLKAQKRLNDNRNGRQLYTDEIAASNPDRFELRYMTVEEELEFAPVIEATVELPSTITVFEREVVALLLLDLNQTEIAGVLCVTRARVRTAHAAVRVKMADWEPSSSEPAPLRQAA